MKYESWDEEYLHGTHWEGKVSKHIGKFLKYLKKGDKILDAGCGTGRNSIYLKERGYDVVGTDLSKVAISRARKAAKDLKIQYKVDSVEKSSFPDRSFDKIFCGQVLHAVDFEEAVRELYRILKPDGILFIVMYESTVYEDGSLQHPTRNHSDILKVFRKYFTILKNEISESDDEDGYGKHHHVRLTAALKKP